MHPLALSGNNGGFTDFNEQKVKAGDKVLYVIDGRTATLDEAFHDGDAFVTFDDGAYDTVKWRHLQKITDCN